MEHEFKQTRTEAGIRAIKGLVSGILYGMLAWLVVMGPARQKRRAHDDSPGSRSHNLSDQSYHRT
jgi:hypothetical protein